MVEHLKVNHIRPQTGETAAALLHRSLGKRFLLLNVTVDGLTTSVCVNVQSNGSAAWRKKEENKKRSLKLDSPGFSLTDRTLVLSYDDVNMLANNFHVIFEAIPSTAVADGCVAVGKLPRDGAEMGRVLDALEHRSADILAICNALELSLDTKLLSLRRSLPHNGVRLMIGDRLSDYAGELLSAFSESQRVYAGLPLLRGFGTENTGRGKDLPNKGDARLRYYMQHNPSNPLGTSRPLDYLAYELKPLNISDTLKWNCCFDPRTESVDLLMSLGGSPLFTEVKMAGDKFVSAATVQLLYYGSILANDRQKNRLAREIKGFTLQEPWLCIIAQQRDESKANEAGFARDLGATLSFLENEETRRALCPFFGGMAVVVIEECSQPFCTTKGIPSFRVVEYGEHFIEWRK